MKFRIALLAALSIFGGAALGQTYEQAIEASQKGDYATAFSGFSELAARGDGYAQYRLGLLYFYGDGTGKDYEQAARWLRSAADQGHVLAQTALGFLYITGTGVARDDEMAYFWLLIASANGDKAATKNRDLLRETLSPQQQIKVEATARSSPTLSRLMTPSAGIACPIQIAPTMPPAAIAKGISGTVRAKIDIKNGAIQDVTILSGPAELHDAVRTAISQYKCRANSGDVLAIQDFKFTIAE